MTREELVKLEAIAQRAADDFDQRQDNLSDYPAGSIDHDIYARSYGIRLAQARAEGTAL